MAKLFKGLFQTKHNIPVVFLYFKKSIVCMNFQYSDFTIRLKRLSFFALNIVNLPRNVLRIEMFQEWGNNRINKSNKTKYCVSLNWNIETNDCIFGLLLLFPSGNHVSVPGFIRLVGLPIYYFFLNQYLRAPNLFLLFH